MLSVKSKVLLTSAAVALAIAGCAATGGGGTSATGIPLGATPAHEVQPLPDRPRFGQAVSEADLAAWNIDIRTPDGRGLPPGRGTVAEGQKLYQSRCVACHGEGAKGGSMYGSMVGGIGSFKTNARVLTPGSMYPYAPILFDYIRRTMPMDAPQTLSANEVYALSAYILNLNGLIPANAVMDQNTLAKVQMPNRDGFVIDNRPDVRATRCMSNCK
jgi:S-disulfanyl-L-cysteine oxidoreductase SoxD